MKHKCQLQIGVAQYENAAMPLSTSGINTRDVVALLKSEGACLYWALFCGKNWGPEVLFTLIGPKKWGGGGGSLKGNYIPIKYLAKLKFSHYRT